MDSGEGTKFNPREHLRKVKGGQDYLEVKYRLVWAREDRGDELDIETAIDYIDVDKGVAVITAHVYKVIPVYATYDESGHPAGHQRIHLATGTKMETKGDFGDYLEKAQTGAIGRALGILGYGTQWAVEFDEGETRLADAPVDKSAYGQKIGPVKAEAPFWESEGKDLWEEVKKAWKAVTGESVAGLKPVLQEHYNAADPKGLTRDNLVGLKAAIESGKIDNDAPRETDADGRVWVKQANGEWAIEG